MSAIALAMPPLSVVSGSPRAPADLLTFSDGPSSSVSKLTLDRRAGTPNVGPDLCLYKVRGGGAGSTPGRPDGGPRSSSARTVEPLRSVVPEAMRS
eukprot:2594524-Pyramimonas_sp.AAC.2